MGKILTAVAVVLVGYYAVGFYYSYRTLDFAHMRPQLQAGMKLGLMVWVGTKIAIVLMIVGGVQKFRAAAPGRRWRALGAWALKCVVIWIAVGFVFVLAFTVIRDMPR
jgi:hypothetical protein